MNGVEAKIGLTERTPRAPTQVEMREPMAVWRKPRRAEARPAWREWREAYGGGVGEGEADAGEGDEEER